MQIKTEGGDIVITLGLLEQRLSAALEYVKERIETLRWENRQLSLTREAALSTARAHEVTKTEVWCMEALLQGRKVTELTVVLPVDFSPIPHVTCDACGCASAVSGVRCPNCDAEVSS